MDGFQPRIEKEWLCRPLTSRFILLLPLKQGRCAQQDRLDLRLVLYFLEPAAFPIAK
jgi:hypothetical protein